jgi:hypothetical protein
LLEDSVGIALQVALDGLSPAERIAAEPEFGSEPSSTATSRPSGKATFDALVAALTRTSCSGPTAATATRTSGAAPRGESPGGDDGPALGTVRPVAAVSLPPTSACSW